MTNLSTLMGTKEPEVLPFRRENIIANFQPSTGQVVGAFVSEMFQGEGSLNQDIIAGNIKKQEEREDGVSEEEWKESENFRPGLTFYEGITKSSAATLAETHDDRENRKLIMSKASGLQTAAGFGVGFATGIFEPKNFAAGVVAAMVTGLAGSVIPSLGRMLAVNSVRTAAVRGGGEGALAAAAIEPSNLESSRIVQGDYTMADSLMNLGLNMTLGAGLGAGAKALELRGRAKRLEQIQAYRAERRLVQKEFDTALAQVTQGSEVNVNAIKQVDNVEQVAKAGRELPRIEEQIAAKQAETGITKVTDRPEFKAWFEGSKVVDDTGAPMVVYHGTNADINSFDMSRVGVTDEGFAGKGFYFTNDPKIAGEYTEKATAGSPNIIPTYIDIKNPLVANSYDELLKALDLPVARDKTGETSNKVSIEAQKRGYDGIIIRDEGVDEYVAFKPTQIKSIFNRGKFDPNDPRLIDLETLEVQKGKAEAKLNTEIDQSQIKQFQNDLGRADNSTAYGRADADDVQAELDKYGNLEDQIALERELEAMQEQIAELQEQGLLNDAELKIMEKLSEIDAENAIFDNVLLNAKICLTRG